MSLILGQTAAASDLSARVGCSPDALGSGAAARVMSEGGAPATSGVTLNLPTNTTPVVLLNYITAADHMSWSQWLAGTYTVRINVTTANMFATVRQIDVCRLSSAGTNQGSVGSWTGTQSLGTAGVLTFTIAGSAQSAAVGDRLFIAISLANTTTMAQSVGITSDQNIDTPLVRGVFDQFGFRVYADGADGESLETTALGAQNEAATVAPGTVVGVRFGTQNAANTSGELGVGVEVALNGGAWSALPAQGASGTPVRYANGAVTDGAATTQRLTGGTGSYVAGRIYESASSATRTMPALGTTEDLVVVELVSGVATTGDEIQLRLVRADGTPFASYSQVARLLVSLLRPKAETLTDTFDGPAIDSEKWSPGDGVAIIGGRLRLTDPGDIASTVGSVGRFDLLDSYVMVELVQQIGGTSTDPTHGVSALIIQNAVIRVGRPGAGGLQADIGAQVVSTVYDPAAVRFLRLREDSGTLRCEYSATAQPGSWVVFHSVATPAGLNDTDVLLRTFQEAGAVPDYAEWDNLNVVPAPSTATKRIRVAGAWVDAPYRIRVGGSWVDAVEALP